MIASLGFYISVLYVMDYYKSTIEENKFNLMFALYFAATIILSIYVKWQLGLVGSLVIAVLLTYKCGIEIDQAKGKFRCYISVLSYSFGEWRVLPENIEYVAIVRLLSAVENSVSTTKEENGQKYKLNFVVNDTRRFVNLRTMKKEIAIKEALNIGNAFNLRVFDGTDPDKKWLR